MKTDQILQRNYDLETGDFEQKIRADERAKLLAEVESWLVDEEETFSDGNYVVGSHACNGLRAELRAKVQEMKGRTV